MILRWSGSARKLRTMEFDGRQIRARTLGGLVARARAMGYVVRPTCRADEVEIYPAAATLIVRAGGVAL